MAEVANNTIGTDANTVIAAPRIGLGERSLQIIVPVVMLSLAVVVWQLIIVFNHVPKYILPSPVDVATTLWSDWGILFPALRVTLAITFEALALAVLGGVLFAVLLVQSRWIELALYPFAVILQVTPVVAISPLILIYSPTTQIALLIVAFLVAFFPILSNMVQGLKSVDHNLLNLFNLYGAGRWQQLIYLRIPASMPYFLTGLRIGGGLALIAAVVAEFAAGSAGANSGLAFRILEAGFRLNVSRMFAALILLTTTGIAIFGITSFISWLVLHRWHESAVRREN